MAVSIRLTRRGAKKRPFYRVVAADSRFPRDGRYLERLGTYNPLAEEDKDKIDLKLERVDFWLGEGAKPSATVESLIRKFRKLEQ